MTSTAPPQSGWAAAGTKTRTALRSMPLLAASTSVLATTAITALLGVGYWSLASRMFTPAQVGAASAAVSLAGTCALLASAGAGPGLLIATATARRAGADPGQVAASMRRAGVWVSAWCALAGLAVTSVLWWAGSGAARDVLAIPAVTALAALTGAGTVLDAVSVGVGRSRWMPVRNALASAVKLAALAGLAVALWATAGRGVNEQSSLGLVGVSASWVLGAVVSVLVAVRALTRPTSHPAGPHAARAGAGGEQSGAEGSGSVTVGWRNRFASHHLAALGGALPPMVLPALVATRLGSAQAAFFAVTWMIGGLCFTVSPAVAQAVIAVAAGQQPEQVAAATRRAARLVAVLLAVPALVLALVPHLVLAPFGAAYARAGSGLLVVLAVSAIPDAVTNLSVAAARARGELGWAAWLNGAMGVGSLLLAWLLLPRFGIGAAGWAWCAAQTGGALAVLVRATLGRRGPHLAPPELDPSTIHGKG